MEAAAFEKNKLPNKKLMNEKDEQITKLLKELEQSRKDNDRLRSDTQFQDEELMKTHPNQNMEVDDDAFVKAADVMEKQGEANAKQSDKNTEEDEIVNISSD